MSLATPEQYRKWNQGEVETAMGIVESHTLLASLKGKNIPLLLHSPATYRDLILLLEAGIESSFFIEFSDRHLEVLKNVFFPERKVEKLIIGEERPLVATVHSFFTINSPRYAPPIDQWRKKANPLEILAHFHPGGKIGFSEADQDILDRSSDLIHGVATTIDYKNFSMTTFDPLTKQHTEDDFSFHFVVSNVLGSSTVQTIKV